MLKIIPIVLLMVTSFSVFADDKHSQAVASLNAFNDRFNQSVVEGNADDLVDMYAKDTLWIEQGKPATQGLEEPRKLFNFVTANKGQVTHTIDRLFVSDDASLAVMIGSVDAKMEKVGLDATGTYLFVLRPDGSTWKIVTDMWHQHSPQKGK
ncbi:nuclear transport factor 2 family protein [Marinomonas sp. TI.3.20]|uniref:YybH family protein n=1 Tax=Marinomonas sp. TI.3.20 TaxID=3121296 RepID=UPI00311EB617